MTNRKTALPLIQSTKAAFESITGSGLEPRSAEASFDALKPTLDALPISDVKSPNIDVQQAAVIALGVDELLRRPDLRAKVVAIAKAGAVDLPLLDGLADVARATWFARHMLLQAGSTHTEAALPLSLVEAAFGVRARMLKALEYNLEGNEEVMRRLGGIRAGAGHLDLANDLHALSALYRELEAEVKHDRKSYRKDDRVEAQRLGEQILRLLGAITTPEQALWRSYQGRAFTLLLEHHEEARRVGRFLFHYEDGERLFPSLFSTGRGAPSARQEAPEAPITGPAAPAAAPQPS